MTTSYEAAACEVNRKSAAKQFGLPETATFADIEAAACEVNRKSAAK
jgi:hypothetical protein